MSMRGHRGFTLVELMVALAISGLVMPAVIGAIFQVSRSTVRLRVDYVINQDIDIASAWFSRDLSQAQTTDVADGAAPVNQMRVDWTDETDWAVEGSETHFAEYTVSGSNLLRDYDGAVGIVARNVANIQFSRSGNLISVVMTSTLEGSTETLTYFVVPRPEGAFQ